MSTPQETPAGRHRAGQDAPQAGNGRSGVPLVRLVNAGKRYGAVIALHDINMEVSAGEVTCVLGDNGAGKSTLIKCLTGAEIPDEGEILLDGKPVTFKRPQDARGAGIETVYQNLAVSPALDVASNLYLGREKRKKGVLGSVFRMLDTAGMGRYTTTHEQFEAVLKSDMDKFGKIIKAANVKLD